MCLLVKDIFTHSEYYELSLLRLHTALCKTIVPIDFWVEIMIFTVILCGVVFIDNRVLIHFIWMYEVLVTYYIMVCGTT